MKKFLSIMLVLINIISFSACGFYYDGTKEQKAFRDALNTLEEALNTRDEEKLYNMFAPATQEADADLKENIHTMLSVFSGTVQAIGYDELLVGYGSFNSGENIESASNCFPVRTESGYYWFDMEVTYTSTKDSTLLGVKNLLFYTPYGLLIDSNNIVQDNYYGLSLNTETTDKDIRCIGSYPYFYTDSTALDIGEVTQQINSTTDYSAFTARFGEPAAIDDALLVFYPLSDENGMRYLELFLVEGNIHHATVVDDFYELETIYNADKT